VDESKPLGPVGGNASGDRRDNLSEEDRRGLGEAVQVHPIKPRLKAPGTKRLKLKYDNLLSRFAFKCNLRRYHSVAQLELLLKAQQDILKAGGFLRSTIRPTLIP